MPNPRNKAKHRRETDRLMDMTQNELEEELITALRAVDGERKEIILSEATRLFTALDITSRILGLCTECLQRSRTNQWAKYCYVTCQPDRAFVPLDNDPDGTLRLVYPTPPTIRQLFQDAGLTPAKPKRQRTTTQDTNSPVGDSPKRPQTPPRQQIQDAEGP